MSNYRIIIDKKEKGITLISLVITIIVLLLLTGISISMLTGQNGIISRANTAKNLSEKAHIEEEIKLAWIGVQAKDSVERISNESKKDSLLLELQKKDESTTATLNEDGIIHLTYKGYISNINIKSGKISVNYGIDKLKLQENVYFFSTFEAVLSAINSGNITSNEANTNGSNAKMIVYKAESSEYNCILLQNVEVSEEEIEVNVPINIDLNQCELKSIYVDSEDEEDTGTIINVNSKINLSNGQTEFLYLIIYDGEINVNNIETEEDSITAKSKDAIVNISNSILHNTGISLSYENEPQSYTDGAKVSIRNCNISGNDSSPINLKSLGILEISDTNIEVKNRSSVCRGIYAEKGRLILNNVNATAESSRMKSGGVLVSTALETGPNVETTINGGHFVGMRAGALISGNATINGGTFEGSQIGGIHFANGTTKIKGSTIKLFEYTGDYANDITDAWHNNIVFLESPNGVTTVYMDSCTLQNDYGNKPVTLSTSNNSLDTYLYVSNTTFINWIRVDGARSDNTNGDTYGHLYFCANVEQQNSNVVDIVEGGVSGKYGIFDKNTYSDVEDCTSNEAIQRFLADLQS